MSGSDALIVVQCGMAAIYLVVQNWFDFKFDIRSLGDLSRKIDEKASYLESLRGTVIDEAAVRDVKELCGKFARDVDTAISDGWRDENVKSSLKGEKLRIKSIQDALKGLSSEIPGALARAKAAYNQEVVSGCVKEENTILPPDTRNKDRPA
jgi:hypothetical protein